MIVFNRPPYTQNEDKYVLDAMRSAKMSGDGVYGKRCQEWFELNFLCRKALLTPNCTQALEMAAILIEVKPGDEIIMPSYTFVSTANAFVLRGAKIIFVDIRPDTMNIDESLIESAITPKTKAIVVVHYAGVSCEMDEIMALAEKHSLFVIEDAAQGVMSSYKGRALGTIGHLAAYSFHETKNYTSGGEGGLLLINDEQFINRAEIIREKGTNRSQFFRGMVDKYSWVDVGSSYLPSELQSAYLWGQLELADKINEDRIQSWNLYDKKLTPLAKRGKCSLPTISESCTHNAHMYYIKVSNLDERTRLLKTLNDRKVQAVFHYVPLHTAIAGMQYSEFHGIDVHTTRESERLIRLPLWYGISENEIDTVVKAIEIFFSEH
jgi:dTDP-4-amino-4,6-dideoxygalactose transaminase